MKAIYVFIFFILFDSFMLEQWLSLCMPGFSFSSGQFYTDELTAKAKPLATTM